MKRLPIIRHLRYFWYQFMVYRYALMWASIGIGLGIPNKSDLDHLELIWRGKDIDFD